MKSKLSMKLLGIVVTIATISSLLVGITAAPVSAAAGTLDYGLINAPSNIGNVLVPGVNISFMAASPDGTVVYAYDDVADKMYKSTDSGVTFGAGKTVGAGTAVGLAVSPQYATDKAVVLAYTDSVWMTVNGGAWDKSGFDNLTLKLGGDAITSVDVGTYYTDAPGTPSIIIGVDGAAAPDRTSNVLKFQYGTSVWTAVGSVLPTTGMTYPVYGVKFSPNHSGATMDAEIVCVYDNGTDIMLSSKFGTYAWSIAAYPDVTVKAAYANPIYGATIAFPSNYRGATGAGFMVGLRDGFGTGDLYYVSGRTSVKGTSKLKYSDDTGLTADIQSIAVSASCANVWFGNTLNAQVLTSTNITATTPTWTPANKAPTGTSAANVVAVGTKVYAGTAGYGSAFSVSLDGGVTFNQTSLIYTRTLDNLSLYDLKVVDNNTMFLVMYNSSYHGWYYIFRTTDGAATWQRIATMQVPNPNVGNGDLLLAVSPAYATDHTIVYSLDSNQILQISADGGQTFNIGAVPTPMVDALALGANGVIYAGGVNTFFKTGASPWLGATGITGTVNSIAIKDTAATTIAVGTQDGKVYQSTDSGVSFTELKKATLTSLDVGGNDIVVTYGPDGTLYASGDDGIGIWRYTGTDWKQGMLPDGTTAAPAEEVYSIVVAKDGTLYASDYTDGAGIWRSLAPATAAPEYQQLDLTNFPSLRDCNPADQNDSDGNLFALQVVNEATLNTLYAINDTYVDNTLTPNPPNSNEYGYDGRIMAFKDTLIVAPTGLVPANGALLTTKTTADLSWAALTGAKKYKAVVNAKSDYTGATDYAPGAAAATAATATGLTEGNTYYWKVRAVSTTATNALFSRYSTSQSFITALTAPTSITATFPAQGATSVPVDTTFTWPASNVAGATYEFVIAEELGNVDKFAIIDYSATAPTNATVLRETLKYDTTYWWRVRTVTATSKSDWTTYFFTTAKEPVASSTTPTTPAVTPIISVVMPSNTPVTPIVNVTGGGTPAPTTPVIPTYLLWAVIVVGAVLVIAVIVLIVRTRRIP